MRFMTTNLCTESATVVTASTEDTNFPASNLKNPLRSKRWRSTSDTTQSVVFDFVTTEEVNSVILLWPKEDGIRLTDSAVLKIQANATNVWTAPSVDETLTIDNDYSMASHHFTTDKSYRYWRVTITDPTNPWEYVELGQVWIGKSLDIENAQNGFKYSLLDRSITVSTKFGHKYVDEYPQTATLQFDYKNMDYEDIQILENAFRTNGNRKPVVMVLDPEDAIYNKDHFIVYGLMSNQFTVGHISYNLFNVEGIAIEELS